MPVTLNSALQVLIFLVIVLLLTRPVGLYLYKVFNGERTWLSPVFVPVERLFYRLSGIDPEEEQKWLAYTVSLMLSVTVSIHLLGILADAHHLHGRLFYPQG